MNLVRAGSDLAGAAADALAGPLLAALRDKPRATLALSGGTTPWPALRELARADLDWSRVDIYQVDERLAPPGDPARNLVGLATTLLDRVSASVRPMPVETVDVEQATARYASSLPDAFDVVHLGLGDDGHTASLVPGDPVLDLTDRQVALTRPYRGHRRMTLTYPALDRASTVVWIVSCAGKASMVERLLAADPTIPAGRVSQERAVLVTDGAANP